MGLTKSYEHNQQYEKMRAERIKLAKQKENASDIILAHFTYNLPVKCELNKRIRHRLDDLCFHIKLSSAQKFTFRSDVPDKMFVSVKFLEIANANAINKMHCEYNAILLNCFNKAMHITHINYEKFETDNACRLCFNEKTYQCKFTDADLVLCYVNYVEQSLQIAHSVICE